MANPLITGLGALGRGLWGGATRGGRWIGQGLKKMFPWLGGAGVGAVGNKAADALTGDNQQQASSDEQPLDVETLDATPNITPVQQLNMTTTGVISPMQIGGTPEEKLDYIAASVDSMRRSVNTLVGMVRSLATGQNALNRNVGAVATQQSNKPSFFGQTFRQGLVQGGLGALAALGIGAAASLLAGVTNISEENKETLTDIKPAIDEIKSGQVKPEESKLYNAAESVVGNWNAGQNLGDTVTIETAMESDPAVAALVSGLRENGIQVDTKDTVNSLLNTVKNIKPETTQTDSTEESTPTTNVTPDNSSQTETNVPSSEQNDTVLENSTASPTLSAPSIPSTQDNTDANIEQPLEGETEEDELGIAPQSSLGDQLQTEPENQLLSSTKYIRDRSQEVASNSKAVVTPIIMNSPQAPAQQQMPQVSEGRLRGATLTVAYRTPADTRTYAQDNFTSV